MIKKKCEAILPSSTTNKLPIKDTNIKKLVPSAGNDIRTLPVEKSTGTSSTTTVGKKRGFDQVIDKSAKTTGSSDVGKKRGKYMSFSHRLQLQREAEQKFAKFIRFLL